MRFVLPLRLCRISLWVLALIVSFPPPARAQEAKPLDGTPWDVGVWTSGGTTVPGGTKDTRVFDAGLRLGKVITGEHFGSWLRGNFEYAVDVIPLYYIFEPSPGGPTYGAAFNPVNLKWNFTRSARTVPLLELGGGVLLSDHDVPNNTSHINFVTHGSFGFQFFNHSRRAITLSVRYEHISNAGLTVPNPGVNTVQLLVGMNWFH